MIDIQLIRSDPEKVKQRLRMKGDFDSLVDDVLSLDRRRREIQGRADEMKKRRNESSRKIGDLVKRGEDATPLKEEMRRLGGGYQVA
jgi:seryl-tRNA synthetase